MKLINKLFPKGLAGKLIRFVIIFVLCMGIVFVAMTRILIANLQKDIQNEEVEREKSVDEQYIKSIEDQSKQSLMLLSTWAADRTDDEFWTLDHDIRVLAAQVQDVFIHPERYERNPVYEPEKENGGLPSLQLLYAGERDSIDPHTLEMMERLSNLAPIMRETLCGNEGFTLDVYICTPDGVTLAMDEYSDRKFDDSGKVKAYDPTIRPAYKGAVSLGDMYITSAVHSYFYDFNEVVFACPVYVDDELVAVVEASSQLGKIEKMLAERNVGKYGFSVLIGRDGQLICSQRTEGELKLRDDPEEDIRNSVNPGLKQMIESGLNGENNVDIVEVDGEKYFAAHSPIKTFGGTQFSFAYVAEMTAPANTIRMIMKTSTVFVLLGIENELNNHSLRLILALLIFMIAAIFLMSSIAKKRVRPIQQMTGAVKELVSEDMDFEMKDVYRTGDEIEELAEAFGVMSGRLKEYVAEIVANTAEKEKMKAEMDAASQIQFKMLPSVDPDAQASNGYELMAAMATAKAVGGDLYDFYFLDEDKLVLLIGDVSGKGITAALFMALSKQMIKSQILLHRGDIVEAMNEANRRLCEESADAMFVTVWIGVLTLSTGQLEFVNAGHMYAAVKRGDADFVLEEDNHGLLMGALDFATYSLNTTTLQKGDILYLYTDGVTEAHNRSDELFGDDRLLAALNENKDASPKELDRIVRERIEEFCDGAEQYDDITTLCIRYTGKEQISAVET